MNEQKEEYVIPPEFSDTKENSINKKRLTIIGLVGLIAIVVASAYYYYVSRDSSQVSPTLSGEQLQIDREWNPEGSIFLTLSPKGSRTFGIYEYKIKEGQLLRYLAPENKIIFTSKFIDFKNKVMLVSAVDGISAQIYKVTDWNPEQITTSPTEFKRHPSWSEAAKSYVYSGMEPGTGPAVNPSDYDVYIQDENGSEKKLTNGSFPTLTSGGSDLVVLRNDGLHRVSLTSTSTERIWAYADAATGTMQHHFTVSESGKYIAWAHQESAKIYVMEVTSWAPFSGYIKYQIDTTAFWPVISPNDEFLAFEEMDWVDPPEKPRLVIVDLVSLERREVQDLDAYDQMRMFITDWK